MNIWVRTDRKVSERENMGFRVKRQDSRSIHRLKIEKDGCGCTRGRELEAMT